MSPNTHSLLNHQQAGFYPHGKCILTELTGLSSLQLVFSLHGILRLLLFKQQWLAICVGDIVLSFLLCQHLLGFSFNIVPLFLVLLALLDTYEYDDYDYYE